MDLLNLLLGAPHWKEPEIHCQSCQTCGIFRELLKPRDSWPVYTESFAPRRVAPPPVCIYEPDGQGGCEYYKADIPPRFILFDNFRDRVYPAPGSVVVCDLRMLISPLALEHTGIYDGCGKIIHRDGKGYLARVTPREFISRLDGLNGALSIYAGCHDECPVGSEKALARAEAALHDPEHNSGYDLLEKNCHQFTQYCLTGKTGHSCSFSALEDTLGQYYGVNNWRIWDINPYED